MLAATANRCRCYLLHSGDPDTTTTRGEEGLESEWGEQAGIGARHDRGASCITTKKLEAVILFKLCHMFTCIAVYVAFGALLCIQLA